MTGQILCHIQSRQIRFPPYWRSQLVTAPDFLLLHVSAVHLCPGSSGDGGWCLPKLCPKPVGGSFIGILQFSPCVFEVLLVSFAGFPPMFVFIFIIFVQPRKVICPYKNITKMMQFFHIVYSVLGFVAQTNTSS